MASKNLRDEMRLELEQKLCSTCWWNHPVNRGGKIYINCTNPKGDMTQRRECYKEK